MASTYSTNLGLNLMGTGDEAGTWGSVTNLNLGTLLEQAVSGYVTQTVTDGANTVITIPDGSTGVARNMFIELTGALTAARTVEVPAKKKLYFIYNNTTNGHAVTVKVAGQTGVSVPNGSKLILVCNGTDVVNATSYGASSGANPSATVGLTAVNGSATTFMRSDGAPALNVTISPTWTGTHTFDGPSIGGTALTARFSAPGPIGNTTASTGAFTTLSASSTVSGTGFISFLASPTGSIGTTAPVGGRFTFAHTAPVALTFNTTQALDCSLSNVFTLTMTGNISSWSVSNPKDGQTVNIFITQDGTGNRTMVWPTNTRWPGGTAGVLSTAANAVDLFVATYRASNTSWYATLAKGFA